MEGARQERQRENTRAWSISGMCLVVDTRATKQEHQKKHHRTVHYSRRGPRGIGALRGLLPSPSFFLGGLGFRVFLRHWPVDRGGAITGSRASDGK